MQYKKALATIYFNCIRMTFRTALKKTIEHFLVEWEDQTISIVKEKDFVNQDELKVGGIFEVQCGQRRYNAKILSRGKLTKVCSH